MPVFGSLTSLGQVLFHLLPFENHVNAKKGMTFSAGEVTEQDKAEKEERTKPSAVDSTVPRAPGALISAVVPEVQSPCVFMNRLPNSSLF